jgi:hypothetical protein
MIGEKNPATKTKTKGTTKVQRTHPMKKEEDILPHRTGSL